MIANGTIKAPPIRKTKAKSTALFITPIVKSGKATHIRITHQKKIDKVNQNTVRALILEIAWSIFVTQRKFTFHTQNIIKSHKFFEYIRFLQGSGLINVNNYNHGHTFYTLTDLGRMQAILYSFHADIDRKYKLFNEKIGNYFEK